MVKGAQNFDPEWAKSIKHDPDRPLAPDVPNLKITQQEVFSQLGLLKAEKPGVGLIKHDDKLRPPEMREGSSMPPSRRHVNVVLKIPASGAELSFPTETATTCGEVCDVIAARYGVKAEGLSLTRKQGCSWKVLARHDQVAPNMMIKGIEKFEKARQKWKYPKAIIGGGHMGLKTAMRFLQLGESDFVVIDRMDRVGGTSWMYQANCTSKLQTEYGAYHLEWGLDAEIPIYFTSPWPSRNALLEHFDKVSRDYGLLPYCKLNTNVKSMEIKKHPSTAGMPVYEHVEKYVLTLQKVSAGTLEYGKFVQTAETSADDTSIDVSAIMMYPGNLTLPRKEEYRGEEDFEGEIGYGMFNEIDYRKVEGKAVSIVGHGAFAVENVRTCCEFDVGKIYLLCRRKNIALPRVVSWMCNRSLMAPTCAWFLHAMKPMYDLIDVDVWGYYAVQANAEKTRCQIIQKARFGIGDVYFLTIYMGKMEVLVDPRGVKRLTKHCVHLMDGRKVECQGILKLLGLIGELDNDRLMHVKEMVGFWPNADVRRYLVAEPVSVMATSMGGTSFSPGAYSWANMAAYTLFYPWEFQAALDGGMPLPKHQADMSDAGTPRPAYVVDARHGTSTAIAISSFLPTLARDPEFDGPSGFLKAIKHRLCHPVRKFIAQAKEDWDYYAEKFLKEGWGKDIPYPEYPFNFNNVKASYLRHQAESGEGNLPCDYEDMELEMN